jgi:hypothetical protein
MTSRHAAALALIGWYPTISGVVSARGTVSPGVRVRSEAPISQWEILDSFDSADDCSDAQMRHSRLCLKYSQSVLRAPKIVDQLTCAREVFGTCIATDDPRLKGN